MYGLCRVRSIVIEGLAELHDESQSGRAGAVTKQELRRTYDAVQISTRVHMTYNLQDLTFWAPSRRRSPIHWPVNTRFGNIVQDTVHKIKTFDGIMSPITGLFFNIEN